MQLEREARKIAKGLPQGPEREAVEEVVAIARSWNATLDRPLQATTPKEVSPVEVKRFTDKAREALELRETFTDVEKEALIADGARIYTPKGETITTQRESQAKKGKPAFRYIVDAGDLVLAVPSRQVEVAIYPDPDKFFVPGSFNRNVKEQEKLVAADARDLRKRLDQEGLGEMIPDEASTLTDIIFQHLDATGDWLFDQRYAEAQGINWVCGRTKNSTNSSGSDVAVVGDALPDRGVRVDRWYRSYGLPGVGAVRMIVPIVTK